MISKKGVEYLAKLARIEIDAVEQQKFEKDLLSILNFVEKLKEVDTESVLPVSGGGDLKNITRADNQVSKTLEGKNSELLRQAPDQENGYIKVKAIFE